MPIFIEGQDFAGHEIIGARKQQEDFNTILSFNEGNELLAVLADGMGGHEAGEVASRLAVESFVECFKTHPAGSIPVRLGAALQAADNALGDYIRRYPEVHGMGCTLVAAHLTSQHLHWISVGDSPLFLLRSKKLKQVNEDHSMAPEIQKSLKAGKITPEEALNHPHRNALRSALLGTGTPPLIDSPARPLDLKDGDTILLASDGVQTLTDTEIERVLCSGADQHASMVAQTLLRTVEHKLKRNQDNTTVQIIHVTNHARSSSKIRKFSLVFLMTLITSALVMGAYIFASRRSPDLLASPMPAPVEISPDDRIEDTQKKSPKADLPSEVENAKPKVTETLKPEDLGDNQKPASDGKSQKDSDLKASTKTDSAAGAPSKAKKEEKLTEKEKATSSSSPSRTEPSVRPNPTSTSKILRRGGETPE